SVEARQKLAVHVKIPADVARRFADAPGGTTLSYHEFKEVLKSKLSDDEMNFYTSIMQEIFKTKNSMSLGKIDLYFGVIVVLSGLIATLAGGFAGDKLRDRVSGAYFLVSGVGMLIAFPLFISVLWIPFPLAWLFLFGGVFFLFFNTGPTNTILANVTHPAVR